MSKQWPGDMSTPDLEVLVKKLDVAVTAFDCLAPEMLVRYRHVIDAFEAAKSELAHRRLRDAHIALAQAHYRPNRVAS